MISTPRRSRRLVLAMPVLLIGLTACGAGGSDASDPVARPTGSPFAVKITGPETATPGETVTAKLTNAGRLPDGYRLVSDPVGAVTIAQPDVPLDPGESAEVSLQVVSVPALVRVQSISGSYGNTQTYLSLGVQE